MAENGLQQLKVCVEINIGENILSLSSQMQTGDKAPKDQDNCGHLSVG